MTGFYQARAIRVMKAARAQFLINWEQMSQLGVLVIHGFTAQPKTVNYIAPYLERAGLPYEIPTLRGHGTTWTDLRGVRWQDWVDDAITAYSKLEGRVDRIAVVGHSMGGLVAAHVAVKREAAALVMAAPAFKFSNPLAPLAPLLKNFIPHQNGGGSSVIDVALRAESTQAQITYGQFPTAAFAELYQMASATPQILPRLRCPTLLIHSLRDQVIPPKATDFALERIGSPLKRVHWYQRSGHEMFWDMERDALCEDILSFILEVGR
jgi:carboxylesterase